MNSKDKAQRFHPSKFCGWISCGSAVCCSTRTPASEAAGLIGKEDFSLGESHTRGSKVQGSGVQIPGFMPLAAGFWLLAATGPWFPAATEGCPTFAGFWLTSTFRNPQSEIRNYLDLSFDL